LGLCGLIFLADGCAPAGSASPTAPAIPSVNSNVVQPAAEIATGHNVKPPVSRLKSFPRFQDVADQLGIAFTYANGTSGRALMVEATGGGAGWLDYDRDGRLDLYLCQGGNPAATSLDAEPPDQLYRQAENQQFECVTSPSGIVEPRYSQGVAVGDFN